MECTVSFPLLKVLMIIKYDGHYDYILNQFMYTTKSFLEMSCDTSSNVYYHPST